MQGFFTHIEKILTFNRGYNAGLFNLSWFKTVQMEEVLKNYIERKNFWSQREGISLGFFFLNTHYGTGLWITFTTFSIPLNLHVSYYIQTEIS